MARIKVVIPVNTNVWNSPHIEELTRFKNLDTEVVVVSLETGAESIETGYDDAWNALPTIQEVEKAQCEGYDGVVLSCFGDPALRAAKEAVSIPVVGVAEASIHLASMLGRRFGVITAGPPDAGAYIFDNFRLYEMDHKCVAVKSLGICVLGLEDDKAEEVTRFVEVANDLIGQGADVIIMGCTGMTEVAGEVSSRLQVPLISPAPAALKICESLISLGLSHSKVGFPNPPKKNRIPEPASALGGGRDA
jgi:allantoin racemase